MAAGAHGCISVVSNVAPRLCADLQNACLAGDFAKALALQDRLAPLAVAIFLEAGVTGAKYGLSLLGKARDEVRLPLVPSTEPTKDRDPLGDGPCRRAAGLKRRRVLIGSPRKDRGRKAGPELQGRRRQPQGALQLRDRRDLRGRASR